MSVVEIRSEIHQIIDRLDEDFLKVVYAMLDTYLQQQETDPIVSYDIDGTPRTASELQAILDAQLDAAKRGEYLTLEELRKQSDEWLTAIKS